MSTYAKADTQTQWFQDNWPGADMHLTKDTEVVVLHTTEGTTWPDYEGGSKAPNYTGRPNMHSRGIEWRAHFPDEKSSRALVNLSGGVETNTLNAVQVELIGTCDPAHKTSWGTLKAGVDYIYWPDAPQWALNDVGAFLADQHERHGLRLEGLVFQAYPGSFGPRGGTNAVRMSFEKWRSFTGVCGHQHVPENVHGDPGNIDIDTIVARAREIVAPRPIKRTRVLVVNAKSGSNPVRDKFVNWIKRRRRAYPVFVSEAKRVNLSPAGFVAQSHAGTKGHQELAIITRECPLEVEFIKLTEDVGTAMAPDRWAVRAVMAGRRVFYALHANAVIQDKETGRLKGGSRGAQVWANVGLPKLAEHIRADIDAGYAVIAGGDMNWRGVDPVPGSPAATFAALGMHYVNAELLGVAFTPEWQLGRRLPILGPPVKRLPNPPGSDHAALSVRLIRRK